jgi:hypothetical protein
MFRFITLIIVILGVNVFGASATVATQKERETEPLKFATEFELKLRKESSQRKRIEELNNLKHAAENAIRNDDADESMSLNGFQQFLEYLSTEDLRIKNCDVIENTIYYNGGFAEPPCISETPDYIHEVLKILDIFCPKLAKSKKRSC